MPVPYWPASLPQLPWTQGFNGGPVDSRASFDTEVGPPIDRPRTTALVRAYDARFGNLRAAQLATLDAFLVTELAQGSLPFAWRDPIFGDVARWKVIKNGNLLYSITPRRGDLAEASMKLMRLPGVPWWASYVRPNASQVPQVVADWNAGVYGINGEKVAASALPAVTGTFNVYSVSSTDVETFTAGVVITAGGIPTTAPIGVKRRVYFL